MKLRIISAVLLGTCIFPGMVAAAGGGMKDGLWEITTSMDMPGMPYQPPPMKVTHCYTKEDVKDDRKVVPKQQGDCKILDMKHSGNRMTWKMVCSGRNKGTGEGEFIYRGDSAYEGTMKMDMEGMTMTSRYKAKRIGACE